MCLAGLVGWFAVGLDPRRHGLTPDVTGVAAVP
jgi:hypothetical protein